MCGRSRKLRSNEPRLLESLCGRRSLGRARRASFQDAFTVSGTADKRSKYASSPQPPENGVAPDRTNRGYRTECRQGKFKAMGWTNRKNLKTPIATGSFAPRQRPRVGYADGTPFFLVGDTWLAASTWRLPLKGMRAAADYVPGPGISFEEAVDYRKRQGFNSISFISAFPNWAADNHGATFANKDGVYLRNAWEKFNTWAPNGKISTADGATTTAKDMHDDRATGRSRSSPIAKARELRSYQSRVLRKSRSQDAASADEGFVPFLETIRRDNAPSWKAYFDFNPSYAVCPVPDRSIRRVQPDFSGIHLDWIPKDYSLTAEEFNACAHVSLGNTGRCRSGSLTRR